MIDVKELRIGNYVLYAGNTTIGMVNGIVQNVLVNDIPFIDRQINPIPLTPEILEKCCFEANDSQNDFKFRDLHLKNWNDYQSWIMIRQNGYDVYPHMPLIKYLHQLQNLIFALTGSELQIEFNTKAIT